MTLNKSNSMHQNSNALGVRTPLKSTVHFGKLTCAVELDTNSESISIQGE